DGSARRELVACLVFAAVRGVHFHHATAHLVREGERRARLADSRISLEDDRPFIRSALVPGGCPLPQLGDRRGIPDDVVEGLRSILLRPAGHRHREERLVTVITLSTG